MLIVDACLSVAICALEVLLVPREPATRAAIPTHLMANLDANLDLPQPAAQDPAEEQPPAGINLDEPYGAMNAWEGPFWHEHLVPVPVTCASCGHTF